MHQIPFEFCSNCQLSMEVIYRLPPLPPTSKTRELDGWMVGCLWTAISYHDWYCNFHRFPQICVRCSFSKKCVQSSSIFINLRLIFIEFVCFLRISKKHRSIFMYCHRFLRIFMDFHRCFRMSMDFHRFS